jgi:hypothetical protein
MDDDIVKISVEHLTEVDVDEFFSVFTLQNLSVEV